MNLVKTVIIDSLFMTLLGAGSNRSLYHVELDHGSVKSTNGEYAVNDCLSSSHREAAIARNKDDAVDGLLEDREPVRDKGIAFHLPRISQILRVCQLTRDECAVPNIIRDTELR